MNFNNIESDIKTIIIQKHGLKNDVITLQTVVTLGIASQSWSSTKFGGQRYTFQFIGIMPVAFASKGNMIRNLINLIKIWI